MAQDLTGEDRLERVLDFMHPNFHNSREAAQGDVRALWTWRHGEHNLLIYNAVTREIIYQETPLIGGDPEYKLTDTLRTNCKIRDTETSNPVEELIREFLNRNAR